MRVGLVRVEFALDEPATAVPQASIVESRASCVYPPAIKARYLTVGHTRNASGEDANHMERGQAKA